MNRKGFTLVELLAIVIIISMLTIIVLPKITNSVKNYSTKTDKLMMDMIEEAARLYMSDNKDEFVENGYGYYCVPLIDLVEGEYLKNGIEINGQDVTNIKSLKINYSDNNMQLVDLDKCIIAPLPSDSLAGLYDENNVLLASWDELIEAGLDVETDLGSSNSMKNTNILNSYGEAYKLIIDDSVQKIGDYAFYQSGLIDVTIPDSVTKIGNSAFYNVDIATIEIPSGVEEIGAYAFYQTNLTDLIIPNGVKRIYKNAFHHCYSLVSVKISQSVILIASDAFSGCSKLENIVVDENNEVYDSRNNSNAIIQTASNTLIAGSKNTIIPESVTTIGNYAFYGSSITDIRIPEKVTKIGEDTFSGCQILENIVVDEKNTVYDSRNNSNAIIETASNTLIVGSINTIIPETVTAIGKNAFYERQIKNITIPSSVIDIGNTAFWHCFYLKSITIPGSVKNIGFNAFGQCKKLENIEIQYGVISIEDYAFQGCDSLTSITIPSSVTSIGETEGFDIYGVFAGDYNLATIYYSGTATGAPWGAPNATVISE